MSAVMLLHGSMIAFEDIVAGDVIETGDPGASYNRIRCDRYVGNSWDEMAEDSELIEAYFFDYNGPFTLVGGPRVSAPKAEPAPAPLATGAKFDAGKPPMALLPPAALAAVARVLGKGAEKYAPHNWRKGIAHSRTIGAALRHVFAYLDGEDRDDKPDAKGNPGTGESHLACAACELLFALQFDEEGKRSFLDADGRAQVIDDRHRTVKP